MFDVSGGSTCSRFEVTGCRHTDILCMSFEISGDVWALMFLCSIITIVMADVRM